MPLFNRNNTTAAGDDVEANNSTGDHSGSTVAEDTDHLGEYVALDRYISTYRDEKSRNEDDGDAEGKHHSKRRWWQFWTSAGQPTDQSGKPDKTIPESWLETDIRIGLSSSDVEERRKRSGWNELTAEKENLFAKFLGFFTGPILYGKSTRLSMRVSVSSRS